MTPDPRRVKALFQAALDLPDPADRPALLDRECGDDAALRLRVEELLAAHDAPAEALKTRLGAGSEAPTIGSNDAPPDPGATFSYRVEGPPSPVGSVIAGRYKVRQEIGEGGMGTVYLAEQTQPVRRQVALKLIKPGMDSRTVLARFEAERQALALMDHPNIARVLDAGSTEDGRPFFVMELVKGVPLTEYCDSHRLDLPARLALFRQVCSAVQHAHQKGIIHRDLKPSNILVESHDDKPVPKVIDFGLAKATGGLQLSEHSLYSAFGTLAGTPLYMAPEQATFNAIDVDTRADIYALGVVLYELLTGSTPILRATMKRSALDEMLRIIREDEPPTPSSRLSSSEALPSLAASRHTEPARLSRFVRGDLDWIVMKALSKERSRRYDSAIGMANDLERFANHEPVTAGPPTAAYRFRKFLRRHRGRVVAGSLIVMALIGGVIGTTWGLVEARKRLGQKDKANEILLSIFRDLDPRGERGAEPLLSRLGKRLDVASAELEGEATDDPLSVARMQQALGVAQLNLTHPEKAIRLLTQAHATFETKLGAGHRDTLKSLQNLALSYQDAGRLDLALPLLEESLALMKTRLGPDDPDTLKGMSNLAEGYRAAGKLTLALPLLEDTLALMKTRLRPDDPALLTSMNNLATGYQDAGKLDLALPLLEATLAIKMTKYGAGNFAVLTSMNNLATGYRAAGRLDLALPLYVKTLEQRRTTLGPDHAETLNSMNNLAMTYRSMGKIEPAIVLMEEVVRLRTAKHGADHPNAWFARANLGVAYRDAGRLDDALPLLEGAHRASLKHPVLRWVTSPLITAYLRAKRSDQAVALARTMLAEGRAALPSDDHQRAGLLAQIGSVLLDARAWAEAESPLRESLALRQKVEPDAWTTFNTSSMLGAALLGQKDDGAEPLLRSGYEGLKARADKIPPQAGAILAEALDRLIAQAEATNKPDEATAWREEKAKLPARPTMSPQPPKGP